ncbi:hypothetical protein [Sphaerisporangium album]|uniref:hypothetical protein n=1 Tax=Sphaerisporangium album TaxID=509200 RepID=UPI001C68EA86|nr:hypothetical protein [Sphaerisporangium album]
MMIFYGFRPPLLRTGPRPLDAPLAVPAEPFPLQAAPMDGLPVLTASAVISIEPSAVVSPVVSAVAGASAGPADPPPAAAGPPSPRRARTLRRLAA